MTTYFRAWRLRPECPWYVVEQYLDENGRRVRAGQGPTAVTRAAPLLPEAEYDARIVELVSTRDYAGAADLQALQLRAKEHDGAAGASTASSEPDDPGGHSETDGGSSDGEQA